MIQGPPYISVTRVILCAHGDVVICYSNTDIQLRTTLDVFLLYKGPFSSVTRLNICTPFDVLKNSENYSFINFPGECVSIGRRGSRGTINSDCIGGGHTSGFSVTKNVHCAEK